MYVRYVMKKIIYKKRRLVLRAYLAFITKIKYCDNWSTEKKKNLKDLQNEFVLYFLFLVFVYGLN